MIGRFKNLRLFGRRIRQRFLEENFDQLSASLAYTTLLSVVPLLAIVLGVLSVLPFYADLVHQLERFLLRALLPEQNAGQIIHYLLMFSHKAAHFTLIGLGGLLVVVLFLLVSIERAFNHIWRVQEDRPWWKKLRLYSVVLVLWPFVVACVVLMSYFAIRSSLGMVDHPEYLRAFAIRGAGLAVAAVFFGGLYFSVPNAPVAARDALGAGLLAASGFLVMQKGFELYLQHFPSLTLVYGAFATVPIFLVWLYLSWAVVLMGALVAAELPGLRQLRAR